MWYFFFQAVLTSQTSPYVVHGGHGVGFHFILGNFCWGILHRFFLWADNFNGPHIMWFIWSLGSTCKWDGTHNLWHACQVLQLYDFHDPRKGYIVRDTYYKL